jgi:hypothetical protein
MTGTGGLQRVPRDYVENFLIRLPPLDVQKKMVAEIEGYQKVIDGAHAVLDNYRPHIPSTPTGRWCLLNKRVRFNAGNSRSGPGMNPAFMEASTPSFKPATL